MEKIMRKIVVALIAVSLTMLVGCSSKVPDKSYFQLASNLDNYIEKTTRETNQFIFIESIDIASFLNKNGIIFQTENIKYITANSNLWVAPLSQQLEERIVQDLTVLLPNYLVSSKPIATPYAKVKLFIDGFHGSYTGDAIIKGRWVVTNNSNEIYSKAFERKIPLTNNGYDALVKALSKGWQEEEIDFASKIKF